jgi:hypothetical protein
VQNDFINILCEIKVASIPTLEFTDAKYGPKAKHDPFPQLQFTGHEFQTEKQPLTPRLSPNYSPRAPVPRRGCRMASLPPLRPIPLARCTPIRVTLLSRSRSLSLSLSRLHTHIQTLTFCLSLSLCMYVYMKMCLYIYTYIYVYIYNLRGPVPRAGCWTGSRSPLRPIPLARCTPKRVSPLSRPLSLDR